MRNTQCTQLCGKVSKRPCGTYKLTSDRYVSDQVVLKRPSRDKKEPASIARTTIVTAAMSVYPRFNASSWLSLFSPYLVQAHAQQLKGDAHVTPEGETV